MRNNSGISAEMLSEQPPTSLPDDFLLHYDGPFPEVSFDLAWGEQLKPNDQTIDFDYDEYYIKVHNLGGDDTDFGDVSINLRPKPTKFSQRGYKGSYSPEQAKITTYVTKPKKINNALGHETMHHIDEKRGRSVPFYYPMAVKGIFLNRVYSPFMYYWVAATNLNEFKGYNLPGDKLLTIPSVAAIAIGIPSVIAYKFNQYERRAREAGKNVADEKPIVTIADQK